jgi:uncharacterized protein
VTLEMTLFNVGAAQPVATAIALAVTRAARRQGLLGRDRLEPNAGLLLAPCVAIHTAFMRFALDVAFVDRTGRVLKVAHSLPPWRIAVAPRAHAVIELAAGTLSARDVRVGDRLYLSADGEIAPEPVRGMVQS